MSAVISALRAQQFEQALRLLQPALERSSKDPRLWSLQGVALSGEGRKKEALAAFQHALSLAPGTYTITVEATGFAKTESRVDLLT
ncbi:tetratricopeptide repeat protein [Edaphobacter aggregans]|uniref:tetratricopeptide repeat protein n=1 Tax=Edaphobacter aggregans TaxID=570835 RepID=UPI00163A49BD|nr:tetratricopeptide repeat protein [Edaphobacter aggregans]